MEIGIIGGGINGLCCAWQLAKGHQVQLYEREALVNAPSRASSKRLHGDLRYLENREFHLVREALRERDAWIRRAPHLSQPLRLVMSIYQQSRRADWMISLGLFLYDRLAGKSLLPKARRSSAQVLVRCGPHLKSEGLQGGYEFSGGQMDDQALGLWVAKQAGGGIAERTEVAALTKGGQVITADGAAHGHDRLINVAGLWAQRLLQENALDSSRELDLVRGSHGILEYHCRQAYLLEAQNDRRIFFFLPWQGNTLVATAEVGQSLNEHIACSPEEQSYLLNAWSYYFSHNQPIVIGTFAGLRPLLRSAQDPSNATREYASHSNGKFFTVLGGKWTTAVALADKVSHAIH